MSRKPALLLAALVSLICHNTVFAEDATPSHSLGLTAGWVGGSGVSYRHYFGDSFVQVSGIATMNKAENREHFDAALNYGHYLSFHNLGEGLNPVASKLLFGIEAEREGEPNDQLSNTEMQVSHKIYTGLGLGLDIFNPRKQGLVVSLDLYYAATFIGFGAPEIDRLELLPNAAIRYNF